MRIPFEGIMPTIHEEAFIAENTSIIGEVTIGQDSSIWFGSVLRGDTNSITIGKGVNIQDLSMVHNDTEYPVEIGDYVTVGHRAIIHGCKIQDHVLVGMGATILNGAEIGAYTIIGAGSLVTQGKKIPAGVLCMGVPAKVIRPLTEEEKKSIEASAAHYIAFSKKYK